MTDLSPDQCRAARALLDISRDELSDISGVSKGTIAKYETGEATDTKISTLEKLLTALDLRGVVPNENGGVEKKNTNTITVLSGQDGFAAFMRHVYDVTIKSGGEICVHNVNEENWIKWMGRDGYDVHCARMSRIEKPYNMKILIEEGDDFFIASNIAEYRYTAKKYFTQQSFYVYGDHLALLQFTDNSVNINIISNPSFSDSYRNLFNENWDAKKKI